MGLDSIEIVMGLEQSFGIRIEDKDAERLFTPALVIDYIATKVPFTYETIGCCLTRRAFHAIRGALVAVAGVDRKQIRPRVSLRELLRGKDRQVRRNFKAACGVRMPFSIGGWFSPRTVGELSRRLVIDSARDLKLPDEPWTRAEIRDVVRAVIISVIGEDSFEDDAHFIDDLRLD